MSIASTLIESVKDEVNKLSLGFVAETKYQISYEPSELEELKVDIVPVAVENEEGDRSGDDPVWTIGISVQKAIDKNDKDQIESLLGILESIADDMENKQISMSTANYRDIQAEQLPDTDALRKGIFQAGILLEYIILD